MSLVINVNRAKTRRSWSSLALLVLSITATVISAWVLYRVFQRLPLPQIQDLALIGTGISLVVTVLVALTHRHSVKENLTSDLISRFFEGVDDPVFFVNRFGRSLMMNPPAQRFVDRVEESVVEQLQERLLNEDSGGRESLRKLSEDIAELRATQISLMIKDLNNEMRSLLISLRPLPDQNISILRVIDLSLQDASIVGGQHGIPRLIQILDHVPIGLYAVDDAGHVSAMNQTLSRWLGANTPDLIARKASIDDYIVSSKSETDGSEDTETAGNPKEAVDGQQTEEVALKAEDGQIFHAFLGRVSLPGSDGGQPLRGGLVLREEFSEDGGDWQAALRRSKLLFKRFFEEAPVAIALVDLNGQVTESNRVFRDMVGEEATGRRISEYLSDEDRETLTRKLAEAISLGDVLEPLELILNTDPAKFINLYIGRMEDDQETVFSLMLHLIDVTEQKSLEEQFVQSQKMQAVGQLAGGVAHDFNNLLTAMLGFCDLLLTRHRPGDPSFSDINQIKQNANRASALVRQLLAFSRQQRMKPEVIVLTDTLAELSNLITRLIGENIQLDMTHDRELWPVKVDKGQFEQVVINLAVNARDAMEGEGKLRIKTSNISIEKPFKRGGEVMPAGDYARIDVSDSGCGIPKENLERIFEPFFSTKEVGSGTGLGLSTVYGIVKQTNGFIYVDSTLNVGTTFHIYFPRHEFEEGEDSEEILHGRPIPTDGEGSGTPGMDDLTEIPEEDLTGQETILFAEDEDPVRMFTKRALTQKGYQVLDANSGDNALEVLKEFGKPIDLLLTDVMMPGIDGPTLISKVREIQPTVKVLCISGYSEENLRDRIENDAGVHFLAKPFSLKDIASTVKSILSEGSSRGSKTAQPAATPPPVEPNPQQTPEPASESAPAPEPTPTTPPAAPAPTAPSAPSVEPASPAPPDKSQKVYTPAGSDKPMPETGGATILFNDDEAPVREFSSRALANSGHRVVATENGAEALQALEETAGIDLLITDVMLPDTDGPTLIRKVLESKPNLKILCISGHESDVLPEDLHALPNVWFLGKPYSLKDITEKVRAILDA